MIVMTYLRFSWGVTMKSMVFSAERHVVWRDSDISEEYTAQFDTCICWFIAWLTSPWKWRQHISLRQWVLSELYGVKIQKTVLLIATKSYGTMNSFIKEKCSGRRYTASACIHPHFQPWLSCKRCLWRLWVLETLPFGSPVILYLAYKVDELLIYWVWICRFNFFLQDIGKVCISFNLK
jgi:hypothetical protein